MGLHTADENAMARRKLSARHSRRSQEHAISDAKPVTEDDYTLSAYGDHSLSEAYNVPAPTTGDYPLRLKRRRPQKPKRPVKNNKCMTPVVCRDFARMTQAS